jgi:hypothetical protein
MSTKPDTLDTLTVPEEGAGAADVGRAAVALAKASDEAAPGEALRARLVGSVGRGGRFGLYVDRLARLFDLSIEAAETLVAKMESDTAWKPGTPEGTSWIGVRTGPKYPGAIAMVGRLPPGTRFAHHAHVGEETTLVLAGGIHDSSGADFERGEEMYGAPGTEHDFVIAEGEDCVAAVICVGGGVEFR